VSTKIGFSAESPSASRRRLIALRIARSKSTNTSPGHSACRNSSRVMTSFGRLSKSFRARKGRSWILTLTPFLRNSSECKSASNTPKSTTVLGVRFNELAGIKGSHFRGDRKSTIETIDSGSKTLALLSSVSRHCLRLGLKQQLRVLYCKQNF